MTLRFFHALTILLLLGTALSSPAHASPSPQATRETEKIAGAVLAVDDHWLDAEVHGDVAWLDGMLLPEYRSIGRDGKVTPKSTILKRAQANAGSDAMERKVRAYMNAHPLGKIVTINGNTAILTFYLKSLRPLRGVTSSDIFVYSGGRWHAIYSQHTSAG